LNAAIKELVSDDVTNDVMLIMQ